MDVDHGRVLGYDNAHGKHERHWGGRVEEVAFTSYDETAARFFQEVDAFFKENSMKVQVESDGFEGHVRRSAERAARRRKGEALPAEKILTFADPLDLLECLTVERIRLCQATRKRPMSVSALAEELGRNRGSVTRDVKKLKELGLLRTREEVNPGHGVVRIVEAVAERLEMRVVV